MPVYYAFGKNAKKYSLSREKIRVPDSIPWLESQLGTRQQVLFEQPEDGYFAGHAPNYAKVYVQGEHLHNAIRTVEIRSLLRDGLLGELV